MGNTTIIEIDHDRAYEIDDNQDTFIRCVLEQCSTADHTGERLPGGRFVAFFHRSGEIEKAWNDFKKKWGWGWNWKKPWLTHR